jgi:hypothetical protein
MSAAKRFYLYRIRPWSLIWSQIGHTIIKASNSHLATVSQYIYIHIYIYSHIHIYHKTLFDIGVILLVHFSLIVLETIERIKCKAAKLRACA